MRIGYFGNVVNDGTIDDVIANISWAEQEGYATYWAPQIFGHDTLTALAVAGRDVPRIELGTSVLPTFPRHPLTLAQQALSTNAAVGGRLSLGIGLSHQMVIENMFGMSFDKPVRHMREYLQVLTAAVQDGSVSFDGDVYKVHAGVQVNGAPAFPVLIAALGPQMLKLAAELADGTITWMTGPDTLRDHTVPTIKAAAEAAGRPTARVVTALPVCVTDEVDAAREWSSNVFSVYGQLPSYRAMLDREGAAGPADVAIIGSEQEVIARIGALEDIGVTDFVVTEFSTRGDDSERTRAAVRSLLPAG